MEQTRNMEEFELSKEGKRGKRRYGIVTSKSKNPRCPRGHCCNCTADNLGKSYTKRKGAMKFNNQASQISARTLSSNLEFYHENCDQEMQHLCDDDDYVLFALSIPNNH